VGEESGAWTWLRLAQDDDALAHLKRIQLGGLAVQADQGTWCRQHVPLATADAEHVQAIALDTFDRAGQAALR